MKLVLLAATLAWAQSPDANEIYYFEDVHKPFFRIEGPTAIPQRPGSFAQPFPVRKPEGELRVFIVGGSVASAYGGRYDLAESLRRALPGRTSRVINVGMAGYDSHREALVLNEVLRYEPDVVVFLSGHNDFSVNASPPVPAWRRKLAARLMSVRPLADLTRAVGGRRGSPRWRARRLAALERNLARGLKAVRASGAQAVVVVPPINYRDTPPDQAFPWSCPQFVSGWLAALEGRAEAARARWREAAAHDGAHGDCAAWAGFHLGRLIEAEGDPAAAALLIADAIDRSSGDFCAKTCQDALRRAAVRNGALLADADAEFLKADAPRLPGLRRFYGTFHWSLDSHWPVSAAVLAALRRHHPGWGWDQAALDSMARQSETDRRARNQDPDRRKKLYLALSRVQLAREGFSGRAAAWLSALREEKPAWFSDTKRFLALAREVFDAEAAKMSAASPAFNLLAPPFPAQALPRHLGHVRLVAGDAAGAAEAFSLAGGPEAALAAAAAEARRGRPDAARAFLARAEAGGMAQQAVVLRSALEAR